MVVRLEYVWVGGDYELRSKVKLLYDKNGNEITNQNLDSVPKWNYDGSSTNQAVGSDSEVILIPRRIFKSNQNQAIVLCDTYTPQGEALETNHRCLANELFNRKLDAEPWFGLEQEYFLIDPHTNKPLGFGEKKTQGQFYCSVGTDNAFGRIIAEQHLQACLQWGVKIAGMNAEVAPGQWEYQIGPCTGIEAGDNLLIARYLLQRIGEQHNVIINIEPKPLDGDWNGSGCHTNYSTKDMRNGKDGTDGIVFIHDAITKLSDKHEEHMKVYGSGNELRMTGKHETASYDKFTSGLADRGASVRIGNENLRNKKGYFEDRRPSSNCDPYLVTSTIFETTVLDNINNEISNINEASQY